MKFKALCLFIICHLLIANSIFAQQKETKKLSFWDIPEEPVKKRKIALNTALTGTYIGTMTGLNYLWYQDTERSKFHFFNDALEWQQVDKIGHFHASYIQSYWLMRTYRWIGMEEKKAARIGFGLGFAFQSSIEIFDGFSDKWGASWSDVMFNFGGSYLALAQQLRWGEQRIKTKYSFHKVTHADAQLQERAENLFGKSKVERLIKDYNSLAVWVSVNPSSFMRNPKKRWQWLNVAFGYAGGDMYGGFGNYWDDEDGNRIERFDVEQHRRFFLSIDADLERIPTKKRGTKTFLTVLNILKMPAPAIEFNTKGEIVFHPMFYLNWNYPLYMKRK